MLPGRDVSYRGCKAWGAEPINNRYSPATCAQWQLTTRRDAAVQADSPYKLPRLRIVAEDLRRIPEEVRNLRKKDKLSFLSFH